MKKQVELGNLVRDKITGFEGIATAICNYLVGQPQVLVEPKAINGNTQEAKWQFIERLEVIE